MDKQIKLQEMIIFIRLHVNNSTCSLIIEPIVQKNHTRIIPAKVILRLFQASDFSPLNVGPASHAQISVGGHKALRLSYYPVDAVVVQAKKQVRLNW